MQTSKLILSKSVSLFESMKLIDQAIRTETLPLTIDMSQVSFPLTRDVFYVLAKRFRIDQFKLLLAHEYQVEMARSASINALLSGLNAEFEREFESKNLLKHNFTMWEYFLYELKRWMLYIKFLFTRKKEKIPLYKIKKATPNTILIVSGLIMSLSLLLFIFYFTVSKTYVYITPQISVRPISANIIFSQGTGSLIQSKNTVQMRKITLPIEYSMNFQLDTIDSNSATNAGWTITLYNELSADQALKPNTRFVTDDGLVFRSDDWVSIPAAKTDNGITQIGTVDVSLHADLADQGGKITGIRGNIPVNTLLSIPGLKFNRDKVYGKAKIDFTGWMDPKIHIITDVEVKKLKWILHEQLARIARSRLQTWIEESNTKWAEEYALLMGDAVTLGDESIIIDKGKKIGDLTNDIDLKGMIDVTALLYDRRAVINYLTSIFRDKLLYGTDKELGIHDDTLRLTNVVNRAEDGSTIKATMEMNATITYDLENATNELTKRMKLIIAGLGSDDAKTRLINEWHVREVSIRFSPFWMTHVSSNLDNIEFIIKNEK